MTQISHEIGIVIFELVEFWHTHREPPNLAMHIDKLPSIWGQHRVRNFFQQTYRDLYTNRHITNCGHKYADFSIYTFRNFLETEYYQYAQTYDEQQGQIRMEIELQAKTKAHEEYQKQARKEFEDLGEQMMKATTHAERVELTKKRVALAPRTGLPFRDNYETHCWYCKEQISSMINAQCPECTYYICACGACLCHYNKSNTEFTH